MGVFDEFSRFLETRLEEFLRNNPHLELQALLEQLREQEGDARRLLQRLEQQKNQQEQEILSLAQDIKTWHGRIEKAQQAGRPDLAAAAQEREAALLHQGNLVWGQRTGTGEQMRQAQTLLEQILQRQQEVQVKITALQQTPKPPPSSANSPSANADTVGWNQGNQYKHYQRSLDPLEQAFQKWELEDELQDLKRNMGR